MIVLFTKLYILFKIIEVMWKINWCEKWKQKWLHRNQKIISNSELPLQEPKIYSQLWLQGPKTIFNYDSDSRDQNLFPTQTLVTKITSSSDSDSDSRGQKLFPTPTQGTKNHLQLRLWLQGSKIISNSDSSDQKSFLTPTPTSGTRTYF